MRIATVHPNSGLHPSRASVPRQISGSVRFLHEARRPNELLVRAYAEGHGTQCNPNCDHEDWVTEPFLDARRAILFQLRARHPHSTDLLRPLSDSGLQ